MNVLVTGGTGTLGRHVVLLLRQSGHRARIFSRQPRGHVDAVQGDLKTGAGLAKALGGMDAIIHAASAWRDPLALRGIDGVSYRYYGIKLGAEAVVKEDLIPWSILRATQFHEFMELTLNAFSRLPGLTAVPFGWQFQPVDSREVARRVVDAVLGRPSGMLSDFGGPEARDFKSIAVSWLRARRSRRRLVNLRLPLKGSRQVAAGGLLSLEHRDGTVTFDQYLAEKYAL